jgi:3-methyladenine DNA glycosylase/8-oxoguanine DNA glycosylase
LSSAELGVRPRGPYSLAVSARLSSDATRTFRDGLLTARVDGEVVRAWQSPDGTVWLRGPEAAAARLRWLLALDDDHSEFLRAVRSDPLLGRASRELRGLRPVRVGSVAQALLRALCGQLIEAKRARRLEQKLIRATTPAGPEGLHEAPSCADLGRWSAAELRAFGLHSRRAAALVRICRELELERLHAVPTPAVAARLERERCLGPWSVGVVCLEGLGRFDYGLVGDLGLVKLLTALRGGGARVETGETAALLEPYGEWAGIASVYLLAGFGRGLIPLDADVTLAA